MQATMKCKTYVNDYYSLPLMNVDGKLKKKAPEPATIIELFTTTPKTIFKGDILVVDGPAQHKTQGSPAKAQILYAELVDRDGIMTITVGISDNFIK